MLSLNSKSYILVVDMNDSNVRLDYDNLPKELRDVIEPASDVTEKEMSISFDGKQFLVRFPKDIAKAIGVKKGDRIKIRVELPSPKTNQQEKIEITYVRSEKGE